MQEQDWLEDPPAACRHGKDALGRPVVADGLGRLCGLVVRSPRISPGPASPLTRPVRPVLGVTSLESDAECFYLDVALSSPVGFFCYLCF